MKFKAIEGKSVWNRQDIEADDDWIWSFPKSALDEIDKNLVKLSRRDVEISQVTARDFPLESISSELNELRQEIDVGRGFQILRGVPVNKYSPQELRVIFWGISTHFGTPLPQTKLGELFIDVRNEGGDVNKNMRGYHSPKHLPFHTDGGHIVGLLCVNQSVEGGLSLLASSAAIHNRILQEAPDLLASLYVGFPMDRRGAEPDGEPRLSPWKMPVFSWHHGRLSCVYDRRSSEWGVELSGGVMPEQAVLAFDLFDQIASSQEYQISMTLEPGDIQWVNNFSVIHSRTSFVDDVGAGKSRHLMRIWLECQGFEQNAINKLHLYTRSPLPSHLRQS